MLLKKIKYKSYKTPATKQLSPVIKQNTLLINKTYNN